MGQQQLILLVLSIVIVGLAVVVGLQIFDRSQGRFTTDGLTQDLVRTGADVQAWSLRAAPMGGGGGDWIHGTDGDGDPFGFVDLSYRVNADGDYVTPNGLIRQGTTDATAFRLNAFNDEEEVRVLLVGCGLGADDVRTAVVDYADDSAELNCDGTIS